MRFLALVVLVSVLKEGMTIDDDGKRWPNSAVGKTWMTPIKNVSWNDNGQRPSQSNSTSSGDGERSKTMCNCSSTVNWPRILTVTPGNHRIGLDLVNTNSSSGRISRGVADYPNGPRVCKCENSISPFANVAMRDFPPPQPPPDHWGPFNSLPLNYIQDRFRYTNPPKSLDNCCLSTDKSKLCTYNRCPSSSTVTTTPVCTTSTRCPTTTGHCVVTRSTRRRWTACYTTTCATTTTSCATTTTSCPTTTTPCATTTTPCATTTTSCPTTTTSCATTTTPCATTTTSCATTTTPCATTTTPCTTTSACLTTTSCGTTTTCCGTTTTSCGTTKTLCWLTITSACSMPTPTCLMTTTPCLTTTTPCPTSTSTCPTTTTPCETIPPCVTSTENFCETSTSCEPIIRSEYVDLFPQAPHFRPELLPPFKFRPFRNPAPRSVNNAEVIQEKSQGRDKIAEDILLMYYLLRLNNLTEKIATTEKGCLFKSSAKLTPFAIAIICFIIFDIFIFIVIIIVLACSCNCTSNDRRQ